MLCECKESKNIIILMNDPYMDNLTQGDEKKDDVLDVAYENG